MHREFVTHFRSGRHRREVRPAVRRDGRACRGRLHAGFRNDRPKTSTRRTALNRTFPKSALAAILCAATNAFAVTVVLDFEGVGDGAGIENFYNGGTDSQGNSGTDHGVSFGSNALGLVDSDAGGSGNFANEPSPGTVMYFLTGSAVLNYAAGFDTGFSFFYSASASATVKVYDGLDATGNLLASLALTGQSADGCSGDPTGIFCNWTAVGATFFGTARSVDFGGTQDRAGYDDITFGSAIAGDPGEEVPEPASPALVAAGLVAAGATRRRLGRRSA